MTENNTETTRTHELVVTLEGELMENGSIEYKTLFNIVEGTASAVERISKLTNYDRPISFHIRPPKEKCFEITLQAVEFLGASIPLLQQAPAINDLVTLFVEYMKILKSLKGEKITNDKIQTNESGNVTIKNNNGDVIYVDNKKVVNQNFILVAGNDRQINKQAEKITQALAQSKLADTLKYNDEGEEQLTLSKQDADFFKYDEVLEARPESVVGHIRQVNDRTHKGLITIEEDERERTVNFELDIKDIGTLEKTVRNLAIAEGTRQRVALVGERQTDSQGKLKKIIANEVVIPDQSFEM